MLIDTHAHLSHTQLLDNIQAILDQARESGVTGILCVGTTLEDSLQSIALAERFDEIRAAVGIHPNNCCQAEDDDWARIVELSNHPAVVALGETGLDRYWDDCSWEDQLSYFSRHIQLARETELPVVIHTRDCCDEMVGVLQNEYSRGQFRGVMHSFTGSLKNARELLELGLYISFAGMITFKNSFDLRAIAREIPFERLLVETDSPYLTPHPFRGQRPNRPDLVRYTAECLAELFGVSLEELSSQTTQNAMQLFHRWQTTS